MPHDGVAALAGPALSTPAVPTPPTRVSVAAAASTLLLMDMGCSSLGTHSRALRTAVSSLPRSARRIHPRFARHAAGSRRPDQDQSAVLTGHTVWRGKTRARPGLLRGTGRSPFPLMKTRDG